MKPPRLLRRRVGCENRLFEVYLDSIEDEQGRRVDDYMLMAPRRRLDTLVAGMAILPITDKGMGLLRIYRHGIRDLSWEIPRGFLELQESAETGAVRELKEETGLVCSPQNVHSLGHFAPDPGSIVARIELFVALDCQLEARVEEPEFGVAEFRIFSFDEVDQMILEQKIEDPSTLIAYDFYRRRF